MVLVLFGNRICWWINADTRAKFGFDSSVLGQANGVWHRDAIIKDLSGTVTLTKEESNDIMNAIAEHGYLKV